MIIVNQRNTFILSWLDCKLYRHRNTENDFEVGGVGSSELEMGNKSSQTPTGETTASGGTPEDEGAVQSGQNGKVFHVDDSTSCVERDLYMMWCRMIMGC